MPVLPQPARGGRAIAAGGFVRRAVKSELPEVQEPVVTRAMREPIVTPPSELLAADAE